MPVPCFEQGFPLKSYWISLVQQINILKDRNPNKEEEKKLMQILMVNEKQLATQNPQGTHSTHANCVIDQVYTFFGIGLSYAE